MSFGKSLGLLAVAGATFLFAQSVHADTILKLTLAGTSDIELVGTEISTIDDGNAASPGDQDTAVEFPEGSFVFGQPGITNIVPPDFGSLSLSGIELTGSPTIVAGTLLTYQTTGGTFELYDDAGDPLLTGTLDDGSFYGTVGSGGAATGGWLTVNLGTFTGPPDEPMNKLFSLLDPDSAAMSISFTELFTGNTPGVIVENGVLQGFTADATANIAADTNGALLPEPASILYGLFAVLGAMGFRRRRDG